MNASLRCAVALGVLGCGASQPHPSELALPVANATHSARTPVLAYTRPFQLSVSIRLCAVAKGKLHCRDTLEPRDKLTDAPTLAGLEQVEVTSASLSNYFSCVTTSHGTVMCWGDNYFGELGAHLRDANHQVPVELPNIQDAKRVVVGPRHACAILAGGKVACWGKNQYGENGSSTNYLEAARELVEPHVVEGVDRVTEVAMTWDSTCAVTQSDDVLCWGRSKLKEQRARGDANEAPEPVAALEGISSLASNESAYCAVRRERVVCWGDVMMLSPQRSRDEVVDIGVERAVRVSVGSNYGCAVDASGSVFCFGANMDGDLGFPPVPNDYDAVKPTRVAGIPRAVDVLTGSSLSCAITVGDEVYCWGRFGWNQTGDNNAEALVHAPERISL